MGTGDSVTFSGVTNFRFENFGKLIFFNELILERICWLKFGEFPEMRLMLSGVSDSEPLGYARGMLGVKSGMLTRSLDIGNGDVHGDCNGVV